MFNVDETFKIEIVMDVTTHTIKKGDQPWLCVEIVLKLVWNLYWLFSYLEWVTRLDEKSL